jgi:DNA-binding CsgD family transcriptional regulator
VAERGRRIVGREAELAAIAAFSRSVSEPRALVLSGGPGIGKTTLWEAGVELARERGLRVLSARASAAETGLSSAALIDLLDGVGREELAALAPPQLSALEVALFRANPTGTPPGAHAISLGFLNAVRLLANRGPLLVAVDDVQWLDHASGDALAFCARRLDTQAVAFLLARRPGPSSGLERALEGKPVERLEVGPLTLGATRRVLSERLGLSPPRNVLRAVFETTLGNPLFTLEVGRVIARGADAIGRELPVPDEVEALLGTRVSQLTRPVRRILLALALQADLRLTQAAVLGGEVALDDAVEAGVVVVENDRVRPAHPLLAAAARARAGAGERRKLHLELAHVVADDELRALHLALGTTLPDDALAATAAAAAAAASARGAAEQAVTLAEHALRLTAHTSPDRSERLLDLAGYLEVAGERKRVTELLTPELGSLAPRDRIRAWLRLAEGGAIKSIYDTEEYLDRALAASEGDPSMRAYVLAKKSIHASPACVWQIRDAEAWALEALSAAQGSDPVLERLALHGLGWARAMRGRPIEDVCTRFRAAADAAFHITDSPEPVEGLRLLWRGHVAEARTILTRFLALADARGEEVSYALQRMQVCDLELRAGEWADAARLLDEWESADRQLLIRATYDRSRALLAAGRGLPEEAERWAASALQGAEPGGYRWQILEALRARGTAALLARDPELATKSLRAVWAHMEREGVDEPGVFPVAPELVEALVELGDVDEARAVTDRLRELAVEQEHPWGLATSARCDGLVRLSRGAYDEEAASMLDKAAVDYGALGLRFDRARALLSLGRAQRRLRKWGASRHALERAAAAFDDLGSPGWAEWARSERARVGGRQPRASGDLTPAEQRVVELAAEGLANKEIARHLFVTVRTVEFHLKHAYAKLGVRSRAQLARRLSERA